MKSNFLKLGSMLLCGAMFATVACTDFSEDMNQMAGDVDALEVTLGGLQDELDALKGAHDALEDLVALKADTKDLEKAVADLQGDVKKVSDALANYATADELDKAVADVSAQVKEVVEGLQGQIDALKSTSATKDDLKKVSDDLAAAKTDLQKSITAVEEATKALANGAVKENTEAIAKLDEAVKDLQGDVKTLDGTVKELGERITKAEAAIKTLEEKTIPALEKAIKDVEADLANYVTKDALNELIKNYASASTVKAVQDALIDAQAQLSSVAAMLNTLIADVYGLIQSLVFVPEYDDLAATAYGYKLDDEYLNDQVVVKGTYQVTPFAHVNKVGTQLVVKAVLQEVDTRSAETPYIWAETVNVTATNDATGKFDIDAVFDIEKYDATKQYVLTVYVQHPEGVNQDMPNVEPTTKAGEDEIDDNMGVTGVTESIIQNYMASNFVSVYYKELDITELYRLVKDNKAYTRVNDSVEWSATAEEMKKTPFAGYEVMLELEQGKFTSIEDAAAIFCVEPELITPKYWQNEVKMGAKNIKNFDYKTDADFENHAATVVCNVHGVAAGTTAWDKVYSIEGEPTPETAKNFVGHRLQVNGYLYFGKDVTKADDLRTVTMAMPAPVVYTYTIDYRTASLTLSSDLEGAHSVAWNYATAKALSTTTATPYDKSISTLGEQYSEYEIVKSEKIKDIDYKKVMEAAQKAEADGDTDAVDLEVTATPATVNSVTVAEPTLVITPETHLLAEIASVDVTGYQFYSQDVKYAFKQTYRDYASFTKVEYLYDLTLGAKPDSVPVNIEIGEISYRNKAYSNDLQNAKLDIDKLCAEAFKAWLPANTTEYVVKPDLKGINYAYDPKLYIGEIKPANAQTVSTGTQIFLDGPFDLAAADIDKVYKAANANGNGFVQRKITTWYGVDFVYTAIFTITAPAYSIEVRDAYVDVENDNKAYLEYQYDSQNPVNGYSQYTIKNADLTNYFKVVGKNTDNKVVVEFTIKPVDGATGAPGFVNYSNTAVLGLEADILPDGTIKPGVCEIAWNNYNCLTADVEAQLWVNGAKFLDPVVVTLVAPDPIEYITAENVSVVRNANDATQANPLDGVSVATVEGKFTAADFLSADAEAQPNDAGNYGASFNVTLDELTAGQAEVYYYNVNNVKTYLPKEHYNWDAATTTITLAKEAAVLLRPIYADFNVEVVYTLNGDVDYTADDCAKKTKVQVEFKVPSNN